MRRLAYNTNGILLVTNQGEYYAIRYQGSSIICIESRHSEYNASNALAYFTEKFGLPDWVREGIERF